MVFGSKRAFSWWSNRCKRLNYFAVVELSAAVRGGEGGGADLQVPGLVAVFCAAADGDGVDAVGVAVAGAVIALPASVTRRPNKDGAETLPALHRHTEARVFI